MTASARRWTEISALWAPDDARELQAVRRRMRRVSDHLAAAYGTPSLGNLPDPLEEAVYIVMTYQTDLDRAQQVWHSFRDRFETWSDVLTAPTLAVEEVLRPSGFHRNRAKIIRALLNTILERFGTLSLDRLRGMSTKLAEAELRQLPGLDIKGARCVLLYSLGRDVFPVDSNTYRFMQRYGVLRADTRYRRQSTHDELQEVVMPSDRKRFHVNLVVHGQRTCVPGTPGCPMCSLQSTCITGLGQNIRARPKAH